jgi:hypothetical protein
MKSVTIFLSLLFTISVSGQKKTISFTYKPSVCYFGKQNQSFNHYEFKSRSGDITVRHTAGLHYTLGITAGISVTSGLEYSQQGQNIDFKVDSPIPEHINDLLIAKLDYIRIPLTINYVISKKRTFDMKVYSGVSFGIAVKREDNYQDIISEQILLRPANKRYKTTDLAIPFGISLQKPLSKKIFLAAGIEYLTGLTNTFINPPFGVLAEFKNSKQRKLSLSLDLGFRLSK